MKGSFDWQLLFSDNMSQSLWEQGISSEIVSTQKAQPPKQSSRTGSKSRRDFGIGSWNCFAAVISLGSNYSDFNVKGSSKRISNGLQRIAWINAETGEVEILAIISEQNRSLRLDCSNTLKNTTTAILSGMFCYVLAQGRRELESFRKRTANQSQQESANFREP